MDNPVEELAAHSTFAALIDYITLIRDPQPRATRTLFRLVRYILLCFMAVVSRETFFF